MSAFYSPIQTGWSSQYPHGPLSLSPIRVKQFNLCQHHAVKFGTTTSEVNISSYKHFENKPLAVNVCSSLLPIQSCPWNNQFPSSTAIASAGSMPMVGNFIHISRTRLQPQSCMCMQFAQCAQWNSVLQRAYPHPYHVKKHTVPITASSSNLGPLCTQVCIFPTKDSDSAVCYS